MARDMQFAHLDFTPAQLAFITDDRSYELDIFPSRRLRMNHEEYQRGARLADACAKQAIAPSCEPIRELTFRQRGEQYIWELRRAADEIETLLQALPVELSFTADRALSNLLDCAFGDR